MVSLGKSRHKHLLADPDVERWFNNLARGSVVTAEERLRRLGRFCALVKHTPKSLVEMTRADHEGFENFVADFVDASFKKGEKPAQVRNNLITIKSWLGHFGLKLERKIRIPAIDYVDEVVPSRDQLSAILRQCDARARVIASLLAFSGLRPESMGSYTGDEGLRLKDFPELHIKDGKVTFERVPTVVLVRKTLSKARHHYFTFLALEGCEYLREYLELRIRAGEKLSPESSIVGHLRPGRLNFLRTTKLAWEVKLAIKKAGFTWRPYVLRSYTDTAFDIAENRGFLSHPWRQFFMGHKGDIEARYSTNKGRLPSDMVEEMRSAYQKCEGLLSTRPPSREEDPALTTVRTMVESGVLDLSKPNVRQYLVGKLGIENMAVRVAKMKENGLAEEEAFVKVICGELGIEPMKLEGFKPKEANSDPRKIIDEKELERHLTEGWDLQTILPSGKILIRK